MITEYLFDLILDWPNNACRGVISRKAYQFGVGVELNIRNSCTFLNDLYARNTGAVFSGVKSNEVVFFCANSKNYIFNDKRN